MQLGYIVNCINFLTIVRFGVQARLGMFWLISASVRSMPIIHREKWFQKHISLFGRGIRSRVSPLLQ